MFPYTFETITGITLTVICVILMLYFIVLKRQGWLKGDSEESFYRCPDQGCRKVFEKPVELRDLSETPARVYQGCPHCGLDFKSIIEFKAKQKPKARKITSVPRKPETTGKGIKNLTPDSKAQKSKTASTKHLETRLSEGKAALDETQETQETPPKPNKEPTFPIEAHKNPPLPAQEKMEESTPHVEAIEAQKEKPPGCPHYFGYLKKLPKDNPIPDKCYSCRRMVDCYVSIPSKSKLEPILS